MGIFDKKYCDVCGDKIGMLGNRKLEDGNLCKNCAKKLSPWFDERRHSTVDQIKEQLAYREENAQMLQQFRPNRIIKTDDYKLYIDEQQQLLVASRNLDKDDNPDLIRFDMITGCSLDVQERRDEEFRTNKDGERVSYNPPRYKYSYDYVLYIYVSHPYFDEMKLELNSWRISDQDHIRRHEVERAGQEMVSYLQRIAGTGMNGMPGMNGMSQMGGMQGMNPAMQNMQSGMGMMNQGMPNQDMANPGMQGGMGMQNPNMAAAAAPAAGLWACPNCGASNQGKFCENCGTPRQ